MINKNKNALYTEYVFPKKFTLNSEIRKEAIKFIHLANNLIH